MTTTNAARIAATLLLTMLLSACASTRYEFVPPQSDMGKQCITQCAGVREQCRGNEMQRAMREKSMCERRAESDYRACLDDKSGKADERKCYRQVCNANQNQWHCENEYRQCFTNCGGRIIQHTQ